MNAEYAQPDFYHFSEDSVWLADWVAKQISEAGHSPLRICDLGAGCGIVGLELVRALKPQLVQAPIALYLCELQRGFLQTLHQNCQHLLVSYPHVQTTCLQLSFGQMLTTCPPLNFDLIVCNPPYFLPGSGMRSLNTARMTCRHFLQDGWPTLLALIQHHLLPHPQSRAYILLPKSIQAKIQELQRQYTLTWQIFPTDSSRLTLLELSHSQFGSAEHK